MNFIDNISVDSLLNRAIAIYESNYFEETGENKILYPADPMRILLQTNVAILYQLYHNLDRTGKRNLLKYSTGDFLKHLAAFRNITPNPEQSAVTTLKFTLSAALPQTAIIPTGSLATAGDNIFFQTTESVEIRAGELSVEVAAVCTVPGVIGNGYSAGQIKTIVQPFPFSASVSNISMSSGGTEAESEQSIKERAFLAPSGFSVAGPEEAYAFWVKSYSQAISDVHVYSQEPGIVDIRLLMQDGSEPDESFISGLHGYFKENKVRPLTDCVRISAPDIQEYDVNVICYIRSSERNNAASIEKRLNNAINSYLTWQEQKIGRDINPSMLHMALMNAGLKRVEILSPDFIEISEHSIAKHRVVDIVFGGVESD